MKKKYNIVLIPATQANSVKKCAHFLSKIADQYLLSDHSLPHLTLYQFYADVSEIQMIWKKVSTSLDQVSIELYFDKFSCLSFDKNIFWASLLPDKGDLLIKMHRKVASLIHQPIKQNYDPHMTLINTKDSTYENLVNKLAQTYKPIQDVFVLAIGESDEIGQLINIRHSYEMQKSSQITFLKK